MQFADGQRTVVWPEPMTAARIWLLRQSVHTLGLWAQRLVGVADEKRTSLSKHTLQETTRGAEWTVDCRVTDGELEDE